MKNPLQFPSYTQEFTVTFPDAAAAKRATARIAPLPLGKKVAFTTRWDDSNPRHLKQAQILHANGMKGDFMLISADPDYFRSVVEPLQKLGSTVGNHTKEHVVWFQRTPNCIFEQSVLFQGELESKCNAPVVSFAFTGRDSGRGDLFPGGNSLWGDWLARGGLYSFPYRDDMAAALHREKNCCFGTYLFVANDSAPDEELFRKGFERCYQAALNDPDMPRMTLGMHCWQSDEGFAVLSKIYAKYAGRPEIWYCSENEYAAYRYNFYHAELEKKAVEGNTVHFRIRRFEPAFTGSPIPLCVHFSESAAPLVLPESPDHALPDRIDCTENDPVARKFPGIEAETKRLSDGRFQILLRNRSRIPLTEVVSSLILPPRWKNGLHRFVIPAVDPGADFVTTVDPGEFSSDPIFDEDREGWDFRIDFLQDGKRGRIHFIHFEPYEFVRKPVPRDCVLVSGPFSLGSVDEKAIAPLSHPSAPLLPLGSIANLQWSDVAHTGYMPYAFPPCFRVPIPGYNIVKNDISTPEKGRFVLAMDFEGGDSTIALDPEATVCFWIDGVRHEQKERLTTVPLAPGRHRIVVFGRALHRYDLATLGCTLGVFDVKTGTMQRCFPIREIR